MTVVQNKEIVRSYLEQYVSKGDRAAADDLVDERVVFASPYSPAPVHGRDAFCAMIDGLRAAMPDLSITEHDLIAEGDLVAARWTASGTHTGTDFAGQSANGRTFEISGMSFYRVAAGRIVEGWVNDDSLGMLSQLGLLPTPAATGA